MLIAVKTTLLHDGIVRIAVEIYITDPHKGFLVSQSIDSYIWIFDKLKDGDYGYVKKR